MRTIIYFFTVFWSGCIFSASVEQDLLTKLKGMSTFEAQFKQTVSSTSKVLQRSRGRFSVKRPNQFRWQTTKPNKQLIIADGRTLWIYDEDLEQVTIKAQDKSVSKSPAILISQSLESIPEQYHVTQKKHQGKVYYKLRPKQQADFQQIVLGFKKNTLVYLSVLDKLDQMSRLTLSQQRQNTPLKNSLFHFKPPKGVDVIKD